MSVLAKLLFPLRHVPLDPPYAAGDLALSRLDVMDRVILSPDCADRSHDACGGACACFCHGGAR